MGLLLESRPWLVGKGMLRPTTILASSLSRVSTFGVLRMFTEEFACMADRTIPKAGTGTSCPSTDTLIESPKTPIARPVRTSEDSPRLLVPSCREPKPKALSPGLPLCRPTPTSRVSSLASSMMTTSTKTCFRRMSSWAITSSMISKASGEATMTREFVLSSAVTRTPSSNSAVALPELSELVSGSRESRPGRLRRELEEDVRVLREFRLEVELVSWERFDSTWAMSSALACSRYFTWIWARERGSTSLSSSSMSPRTASIASLLAMMMSLLLRSSATIFSMYLPSFPTVEEEALEAVSADLSFERRRRRREELDSELLLLVVVLVVLSSEP